ncbi:MAG TPA: peptidoglycan-binding protein, partial [Gemmataceae bacterium]
MSIKGSVGRGGVNRGEDVRAVQVLLNDWRSENALPAIAEDGLAGPETIRAITLFQQRVTRIIDGRVDPNGPAEKRLTSMYVASALKKAAALGLSLLREYDRFLTQKQVTLPISVGSRVNAFRSRLCGLAGSQPQSSGGPRFFNLGLDIVPAGDSIQVGAGIAIPIALVLLALAALTVALI